MPETKKPIAETIAENKEIVANKPTKAPYSSTSEQTVKEVKENLYIYGNRDLEGSPTWEVVGSKYCAFMQKALDILKEHSEPNVRVSYIEDDRRVFSTMVTRNINYSPAIFLNGNKFGSLGELENYYKKNFYPTDYNKIKQ